MTERYTVLHRTQINRQPQFGAKSLGNTIPAKTEVDISVQDLDERQAAEAKTIPGMQLARSFRTKLLKPLGRKSATGVPDWGLDAVGATSSSKTGDGIVVAVLDTGIDAGHESFSKVNLTQRDFSGTGNGDREGHGTHCAGTIFGDEVGGRRIGVAPGIRQALIGKILDDSGAGDAPMMFDGIKWALAQGAHIISLSIGFDFPGEVADRVAKGWELDIATSEALDGFRENLDMLNALMAEITANRAFGTQPLVVAASGNESRRRDNPTWRVSASLPAAAVHLSVAAVEPKSGDFTVAAFSNSRAKLAAPGVDIVSAQAGGGLVADSGTSMACPYVAGVAALWAQKLRQDGDVVEAEALTSHLLATASRQRLPGTDILDVGRGLVAAPQ